MANGLKEMYRRITLATVIAFAALLTTQPVLAGDIEQEWHFYKPVDLPDNFAGPGLVEVKLDREVYAHASPRLGDIRVTEQQEGREVPYKLLVESGDHRRASVPVKVRDLGQVPGQDTSFIIDLQLQGMMHNEVEIQTSSKNFQRMVGIETSGDGNTWRAVERSGTIFDLTIEARGFTTRDTRVKYPVTTARFLRVTILDEGKEPLNVQGGVVFFDQQLKPRRAVLPIVIIGQEVNPVARETILLLDGASSGFPANRIELEIPHRNFYRQASLEGSYDSSTWDVVQPDEALYDIETPKFVGNDLSIAFRESRYRYYRVTIQNEDNPPLAVEGARANGFLRKLLFSGEAGKSYRLYYGNPNAAAPSYELERIFPYLLTEDLPVVKLGVHTQNPAFTVPAPASKPITERYPWLLSTIVAIAALLIGMFLASLVRQLGGRLPPPESPH